MREKSGLPLPSCSCYGGGLAEPVVEADISQTGTIPRHERALGDRDPVVLAIGVCHDLSWIVPGR